MAAAPDPAPSERMEQLLTCSICKEILKEPRTLGCFHSFCKHCLSRYVEVQRKNVRAQEQAQNGIENRFNCPSCRSPFQLKERENVERLPTNFFINNMLSILKLQQQAEKLPCESCKAQVPAESRCIECEQFLCKTCLKTHKNWAAFKDHIVLTLEELEKPENQAKARGKPRCKKRGHEKEHLKFYCNTCQELVCNDCVVLDHPRPDHEHRAVHEVAKQRKEALKSTSAVLQKKSEQGQKALKNIEHAAQVFKANVKVAKDAILQQEREILKEFTAKLKCQTAALLGEVEKKHNEVHQELLKQQNEAEGYVERVKRSLDFAQNIIEKGSNEEIISLGGEIEENCKTIEKECPKLMNPVHTGDLEYQAKSTKSILETVNLNDLGKIVDKELQLRYETSTILKVNGRALLLCKTSAILEGNMDHVQQLAHWVDDKFSWNLCYRASQDGWGAGDFHRKCDEVGPTVTLVKCGTNIFGGYTDQSWKLDRYKYSDASFLFSLQNREGLPPFKCPIYDHRKVRAIFCHSSSGAIFGDYLLGDGHDLSISANANTNQYSHSNLGGTYQPPPGYQPHTRQTRSLLAGSQYFQPTEIEVFHR